MNTNAQSNKPSSSEGLPCVSMAPSARYVGQGGAYDRLLDNGPLTDRKITKYKRLGYFGGCNNGIIDPRLRMKEEVQEKRKLVRRRPTLAQLLDEYK
jgi:hypothetical protein